MKLDQRSLNCRLLFAGTLNAKAKLRRRRGCARSRWFIFLSLQVIFAIGGQPLWAAERLTIATSALNMLTTPLWLAKDKGFFLKYGLDAETIYIKSLWQGGK